MGEIDGIKYLCIGGGVNASSTMIQATQCFDLTAGIWASENSTMAAFPTDPFGAADGILHAVTGDQFWYVGGATSAGAIISDEARYWDDADNSWHFAGNTGTPRYRVEGDFFNGDFYQLGGSSGGFSPTASAVRGRFDGSNWIWTALPDLNNTRMDNVVGVTDGDIWSIDGYGSTASSYVEYLKFCPLCQQPIIQVDPLSLSAIQPTDTLTTQTIQICNIGWGLLEWEITEIPEVPPVLGGPTPLAPILVEPTNRMPVSMTPPTPSGILEPTVPVNPDAILWDQTTSYGQAGVSDDYPPEGWGAFSADDFQNSDSWSIETIFVPGWMTAGTMYDATALHWCIYPDIGGIPGGHPYLGGEYWCGSLSPNDPAVTIGGTFGSDVTLDVVAGMGAPVVVPPGTWWLVFYPEFSSSATDWYYWAFGDTGNLSNAQLVDPMDYFGMGLTTWTPWVNLGVTYWDLAFRLEGEIVFYFDIPWLSESPISGTLPAGECTPVDVTFDSTGLMPGDYFGGLEINSNDPEEPQVDVPVQLTVTPPPLIVWEKFINGQAWYPGITVTAVTSDVIMVEEVLHLLPQAALGPVKIDQVDTVKPVPSSPPVPLKTPETVNGVQPPLRTLPENPSKTLQASGLLYLTSLDIGDTTFAVYDPEIDSWTALTPYETGCQMAVSSTGQLYAYGFNTQTIDLYDPATDTWIPIFPTPPGSTGYYCNLEITNTGEFLYTEVWASTLWYTMGGVWNTLVLPFTANAMGDYDPTTDQYIIGQASTTNAHMIDVHTWTIIDYFSPVGNGEYARFGVVMGNRYYFEAGASNIHYFDLSNPALPPIDTGLNWGGFYTSAAGDRANMVIYNASLDSTVLVLFDPVANTLAPLTGDGYAWHSSVAFVPSGGEQAPIFAQIENWDPARLQLIDWAANYGQVIVQPGHVEWTGDINEPITIMLTKWFHVEPGDWTDTVLWEELWLDQTELEQRPVNIIHNIDVPDLTVDPLQLDATLFPDEQLTQPLNVCNVGNADLTWSLAEAGAPKQIQTTLWDNGPLITHPGGGFGGADASAVQTALGMTTYGTGHQFDLGYWVAEDFEITDPVGWDLSSIKFYAYQTNSGNTPTITGVYYQILDGPPDAGGNVICGDTVTNRLANTQWVNKYRVLDTDLLNTARPPMDDTVAIAPGCEHLAPGSYWIMWSTDGSLASGPWAPPVSILGQTTTGNAMQSLDYGANWAAIVDGGTLTPQGLPFIIEGEISGAFDLPWLSENPTSGTVLPGECQIVDVTFNSTGLAPATYAGSLDVNSNDPDTPKINVPVTLTVLGVPDIEVNLSPLVMTLYPDETGTIVRSIGNVGNADLIWDISETAPWLIVNPASGTTAPDGSTPVEYIFNSAGLTPGDYHITINIHSNDPDETDLPLDATLIVEAVPVPDIEVSAPPLEMTLEPDQSASITMTIGNVGNADLVWNITEDVEATWLTEEPIAGITPPSDSTEVNLTFDSTELTPGVYTTTVMINSNDPEEPVIPLDVTLTVVGVPDIVVTPQLLEMTLHPNQVGTLTFTIENQGSEDLTWALSGDSPDWMSEDPTSGTVIPGGSTVVTVTFDSTGLSQGIYNGFLIVESNDPDDPPMVNVTLTVLNYNFYLPIITKN